MIQSLKSLVMSAACMFVVVTAFAQQEVKFIQKGKEQKIDVVIDASLFVQHYI